MEIKTGDQIYFDGCDVREGSKLHNYDDKSTKERKIQHETKWIKVEDLLLRINNCSNYQEQAILVQNLEKELTEK